MSALHHITLNLLLRRALKRTFRQVTRAQRFALTAGLLCSALLSSGCDSSEPERTRELEDTAPTATPDMMSPLDLGLDASADETEEMSADQSACESPRPPLIMAHGFLASGDTWSRHTQRLIATGSCPQRVRVYDWNTLDMSGDHTTALEALIDELIAESGAESVDLIGHSAGGGLAYELLSDPERALKVRRYVHVGSFANDAPPTPEGGAPVPTLNLWSRGDLAVESADIPGATNVALESEDHYSVATSLSSYNAIASFLYGDEALDDDPRPPPRGEGEVSVGGRALTLGENRPLSDLAIKVWSRDASGARAEVAAEAVTDERGVFSISALPVAVSYELEPILTDEGQPQVYYFTPPLTRADPLLYLRTFPGPGTLASIIVNQLPQREDQISLVFFNAHRALLAGVDSLTLNGRELLTPEVASPENTTIALFVFDINGDGEEGGASPLFERFPFLSVFDLPLTPSPQATLEVNYNGLEMRLPARPSSDGTMIVVFP